MARDQSRVSISISGTACISAALLLLVLPLKWLFSAVTAALFHELCHLAAVRIVGGQILGIGIGGKGAAIRIGPMDPKKELLCALAGPAGGVLLLFFAPWIPRIAVCAAVHAIYNLLPIYPLDGGRALRCIADMGTPPEKGQKLCAAVEQCCKAGLVCIAVYAAVILKLGLLPLAAAGIILLKTKSGKFSCKLLSQRVQ